MMPDRTDTRSEVDSDTAAAGDVRPTASLTAEHMMRGRKRARALVDPVLAEHGVRAKRKRRALPSFSAVAKFRRDIVLAVVWVSVFAGCALLVRCSG